MAKRKNYEEIRIDTVLSCQEPQLELFEAEIKHTINDFMHLTFDNRAYTVNDKVDEVADSKVNAISFFSGGGGLDIGAQLAGVKVISSLDFDKDSIATLKSNKYFSHTQHSVKDIQDVSAMDFTSILKKNNPEKLILIGGPPCQPFSKAGYWKTHENRLGSDDPRNMIGNYLRLISEVQPDGFVLENVESLLHPKNVQAVKDIEETIEKLGYNYIICKANAIDYGVPQKRKRVFFIASKSKIVGTPQKTNGSDLEILLNKNLKPYEQVIDWIGKYDTPAYSDGYDSTEGKYFDDLLEVPSGSNYIALTERRGYANPKFVAGKRYWTFLLKLHPLKPSWTIIASPGHWEGPFHWTSRRLRLKEIAAIQTFPEDYIFKGSRRSVHKQIGNAVPCLLGRQIVDFLKNNI